MRNYKQMIAGAMAAIMVLGSSVVALAADQSDKTTGSGSLDVVVQSDVFSVVMPVLPEEGSPFDYILDPEHVIEETNAAKYGGVNYESGETLYFTVSGGDLKHDSDELTVTNKSSMDVNITVTAKVSQVAGITMAGSNNFTTTGGAQLYLALVDNKNNTSGMALVGDSGVSVTARLTGDSNNYEIKYVTDGDAGGRYEKSLKDSATNFDDYKFHLTGACSETGWDSSSPTPPSVEVVWTIKDPNAGPQITMDSTGLVTISGLTAAKNYVSLTITNGTGTWDINSGQVTWDNTGYSATTGGTTKCQLGSDWMDSIRSNNNQAILNLTLSDGTVINQPVSL